LSKFTADEQGAIIFAIMEAEKNTSGEIRVHIESKCSGDPINHAIKVFNQLKMHETKNRNGILFYVALDSHSFALIGDQGIHVNVGQDFWDSTTNIVIGKFKSGKLVEGLIEGINHCGEQLKKYFPHQGKEDKNELSNEISFD
jgi:uncharacterized membrane protein